jgi:glycosyltransferase involved in cell wall biosynthesis
MKLTLLAHNLPLAGGKSVGQNIIRTLPEIAPMHEYLMIVPKDCGYPDFAGHNNISVLECPQMGLAKRWWWEKRVMRPVIEAFEPDWIWALGNFGIDYSRAEQSVLIHDAHLVYPQRIFHFEPAKYKLSKKIISFLSKKTARGSRFVYAQTDVMGDRIGEKFSVAKEKIKICPNAVSFSALRGDNSYMPEIFNKYSNKFKLFVLSAYYGHKNFEGIINLYSKFRDELQHTVCFLTIAESQSENSQRILSLISERNLENLIVNIGPIEQSNLQNYFASMDALFLPSLLESFSGTYLEAMHFKIPIITSDLDFAHSVCGDAACYVDPYRASSMFEGIIKVSTDSAYSRQLILNGVQRKSKYVRSWDDILKRVLDNEGIKYNQAKEV